MRKFEIDQELVDRLTKWQRLAHSWVLVDQEISLFYDIPPVLTISELETILPSDDSMWLAANADEWRQALCKTSNATGDWRAALLLQPKYSLRNLFQLLMENQLDRSDYRPQPLHMRLLLFPLHILVTHLCQLLNCALNDTQSPKFSYLITQNSLMLRFEEIQHLMHRWLDSFQRINGQGARYHAMAHATLVLYHVINLNIFTAFNNLESFARGEYSEWPSENGAALPKSWIRAPEEALLHCGQIFRLFRGIEDELRPVWSAAAIYRATIVLWAYSISNLQDFRQRDNESLERNVLTDVPLDTLPMNDPSLQHFLRYGKGRPRFTAKDGTRIRLDDPRVVLMLGIETLDTGPLTSCFAEGVKCRLYAMATRWERTHQHLSQTNVSQGGALMRVQ
jgi:hypothetical protein